ADVLGISAPHDERVEHQVIRVGEEYLCASFRRDVHPRRDDVEQPCLQTRDQCAELDGDGNDLVDAEPRENHLRDRGRLAGGLALLVDVTEGSLVRDPDLDRAAVPQPLQQIAAFDRVRVRDPAASGGAERAGGRQSREQGPAAGARPPTSCGCRTISVCRSHGRAATQTPRMYAGHFELTSATQRGRTVAQDTFRQGCGTPREAGGKGCGRMTSARPERFITVSLEKRG